MKWIVPFGLDGAVDRVARMVARFCHETVSIENMPGGGGVPGTQRVVDSPASATLPMVLLCGSVSNLSIAPLVQPALPYDPERDLRPLALVGYAPNVLTVPPSLGVDSVERLIRLARAQPGALAYASAGAGQTIHLCGELFCAHARIELRHVPYDRGSATAHAELAAGQVHLMFDSLIGVTEAIRSGRERALAVLAEQRHPLIAEVPTMAECGFDNFHAPIWIGLFASYRLANERADILSAKLCATLAEPTLRTALLSLGLNPVDDSSPRALTTAVRDARHIWRDNLLHAGLPLAARS